MKKKPYIITSIASAFALIGLTSCEVEKTQDAELPEVDVEAEAGQLPEVEVVEEGELPSVDVDAEGGNLPKFDVDVAEVDASIEEEKVTIPVPDIDVEMPKDHDDPSDLKTGEAVEQDASEAEEQEDL